MKKQKKKNKKFCIIIIVIFTFFITTFYLRQQYIIIRLQKEINGLYEELLIEKNKNKELTLTLQSLINPERLTNYAKKLNFVPVNQKDYIVIE
jgi:cell division protein FtsL